ncbi:putative ethanolamine-phosphate cytidylyltransferase, partial [Hamiltosporidium magnivora]
MVRIWIEGCFDLYHPGHVFAFLMAKLLGDYLTAGLRPSDIIEIHKRKPILNDDERYTMLEGCKYIDKTINSRFSVKEMMEDENGKHVNKLFDFVAHGNDPVVCWNGVDCYQVAKERLMYKEFKRVCGFSTTNLIKRIILRNSSILQENDYFAEIDKEILENEECRKFISQIGPQNEENKRVIYISGTFDLFHAGHVSILKYARE